MGEYVFMLLLGVPKELEDKFNTLYDTDHLPYIMQVSGVRSCSRYRLNWSDNPDMLKYLTLYDIEGPDLPRSEEWKKQSGKGAWPTEIRDRVSARRNGVFRKLAAHGAGDGKPKTWVESEHLYFLQQGIPAELDERFNLLYDTDHIPLMLQAPGVNGVERYRLEWSATGDVPDYLTLYSIAGPDVPRSPEWKSQTNKGSWPVEMRPKFTHRRNGSFTRISQFT